MLFHSKTANSEIHTVSFDSSLPCHWNSAKSSVLESGKIQLVFDFLVKTNQLETNHSNCSNQIKQKVFILLLLKCKNQTKLLDIQHGRHTLFNHVREERERRSQAPYDMLSWIFSLPVWALTSAFFDLKVPNVKRRRHLEQNTKKMDFPASISMIAFPKYKVWHNDKKNF